MLKRVLCCSCRSTSRGARPDHQDDGSPTPRRHQTAGRAGRPPTTLEPAIHREPRTELEYQTQGVPQEPVVFPCPPTTMRSSGLTKTQSHSRRDAVVSAGPSSTSPASGLRPPTPRRRSTNRSIALAAGDPKSSEP